MSNEVCEERDVMHAVARVFPSSTPDRSSRTQTAMDNNNPQPDSTALAMPKTKSDFTLEELQFLVTLLETHSLTLSAERHHLSMGSASRRLARLRDFFEDELFVRSGLVMLPTQRMREIEGDVKEVLRTMQVLLHRNDFDLSKTERAVRILSADNGVSTLLAECFVPFYEQAPKSKLVIEQIGPDIFDRLRAGSADMALYPLSTVPKDFHSTQLYKTRRGILVREGHPLIALYEKRGRITMQDLCAYRQIRTTFPGAPEWASTPSRTAMVQQDVGLEMPFFLAVPSVLAKTDFTYSAPVITLLRAVRQSDVSLRMLPAPKELAPFAPYLIWHHCTHTDPFLQWVRALVTSSALKNAKAFGVLEEDDE